MQEQRRGLAWVVSLWAGCLAVHATLIGLSLLLGGDERFRSPALATVRAIGPWWAWGALYLISGLVFLQAVTRRCRWTLAASLAPAAMQILFAASLFPSVAAGSSPWIGVLNYAFVGAMTVAAGGLANQTYDAERSWTS